MTETLFRTDAYARDCAVGVVGIDERGGIILDRTVLYAAAGGQPGDKGQLEIAGQPPIDIAATVYAADKVTIVHLPAAPAPALLAGQRGRLVLDWAIRHRHMRMHTALHLLCALVKFPITGGQIGADESRLDFDIAEAAAVDKDQLTADLNRLIEAAHPVSQRWITDAELAASPGLVRTMSVQPPTGSGRVRLVAIGTAGEVDLQPCGGTHVRNTGEIGRVAVTKIEKKGKLNRRIRLQLA